MNIDYVVHSDVSTYNGLSPVGGLLYNTARVQNFSLVGGLLYNKAKVQNCCLVGGL